MIRAESGELIRLPKSLVRLQLRLKLRFEQYPH